MSNSNQQLPEDIRELFYNPVEEAKLSDDEREKRAADSKAALARREDQRLHAEIDARFGRKKLNSEAVSKIERVTARFQDFAHGLVESVPAGRELQTALTHLETAKFFANQAIARAGAEA